ncbi:MAG: type III-A CRISPR-associated RAMP protein Csm4 [Marinifilaceae bacterium]|nr:type III-A CRISPR-associated RAMP protein Csm4 [Marinifilaceae bacterium]
MAEYIVVKMKEMTPLHIGTGRENYDFSSSTLHSDTISSALAAIRVKYGNGKNIEEFMNSFCISSAFPYIGDSFFLPRPLGELKIKIADCPEYTSRKRLKSIKYIELSLWKEIVQGNSIAIKSNQLVNGFLMPEQREFEVPSISQVNQRVSVPRDDNGKTTPFFFDWTYFNDNAGLYCLLNSDDIIKEEILSLFTLLGETGIGTDKNIGGGKFSVSVDEMTLPDFDSNSSMLLSLYIPTEDEITFNIDLEASRYDLLLRGGYMAGSSINDFGHLHKKSIFMFDVGSIFVHSNPLKGKIVDLQPIDYHDTRMHPVYRSGHPFVVPVKL